MANGPIMSPSSLNDCAAPMVAPMRRSFASAPTSASVFVQTVPTPAPATRASSTKRNVELMKVTTPTAEAASDRDDETNHEGAHSDGLRVRGEVRRDDVRAK